MAAYCEGRTSDSSHWKADRSDQTIRLKKIAEVKRRRNKATIGIECHIEISLSLFQYDILSDQENSIEITNGAYYLSQS